jgi:hypothetical protein
MIRALANSHSAWHYANGIDAEILADVRARRCALIFDLSNEGPAYSSEIFDELFRWIELQKLPSGQVVWLAQNRNMQTQCRAAAGSNAEAIRFEYYDFFIKMIAVLFAPGSGENVIGGDADAFARRMFDVSRKDRLLLCLNATPRLPRILTVSALMHHGLLETSLVSFPGMSYVKDADSAARVREYVRNHVSLSYLKPAVEATLALSGLQVDEFQEKGNALFAKIDTRPYERTFFSLVTETEFTDGSVDRVTEKIVKPMCLGHAPLIVGNPRAMRFMTDLGFLDWAELIDRTYEAELSPPDRFRLLIDETLRQARLIQDDAASWLERARAVGEANIRHAVSGRLLTRYCDAYDRPVLRRLANLVGTEI